MDVFECSAVEANDLPSDDVHDLLPHFFVWEDVKAEEIGEDRKEVDVEDEDAVLVGGVMEGA